MALENGLHLGTRVRKLFHSYEANQEKAEQLFQKLRAVPGGFFPVGNDRIRAESLQARINILTR